MPANLTPEYEKAERGFREAGGDEERLEALREMLRTVPKHKGTEKIQADIKRRISRMRKAEGKKSASRGPDLFHVPRSGAGQVVLVGAPNAGKSMLVGANTNANVKVADFPYATAIPTPGMWTRDDVQIQLVDTPPVTAEHVPGRLMGTIRLADVIALVVDLSAEPLEQAKMLLGLLEGRGLELRSVSRCDLDVGEPNLRSAVIIANKVDRSPASDVGALRELYVGRLDVVPVSAATGEGMEALQHRLWELLSVVRVYTKQPGEPADRHRPFTLPIGSTVADLAREIHRELVEKMRFARIWGEGRFDGRQVHRTEELRDGDVVEIRE